MAQRTQDYDHIVGHLADHFESHELTAEALANRLLSDDIPALYRAKQAFVLDELAQEAESLMETVLTDITVFSRAGYSAVNSGIGFSFRSFLKDALARAMLADVKSELAMRRSEEDWRDRAANDAGVPAFGEIA